MALLILSDSLENINEVVGSATAGENNYAFPLAVIHDRRWRAAAGEGEKGFRRHDDVG